MKFSLENGVITIFVTGRIDSNTSPVIEKELDDIVNQNPADKIILDFEDVEYLSSAGLRVILRLKKKHENMSIINVNHEVYEIFDMTGFVEMMDIKKAFRKISVDGLEEIGCGANGKVYRYNDDTIIKVYFNNAKLEHIQNEIKLAKKAFVMGVSTAIPFDIVKVGPYYGSVFEMIKAESLVDLINNNPDKLDDYILMFHNLLKDMNNTIVNDDSLPQIKHRAMKWLDTASLFLPDDKKDKMQRLFASIPEDNNMLHRDYHLKNLLMQNNELILIDMDTLCKGNIIFELTGFYNAYRGFTETRDPTLPPFLGIKDEYSFYISDKLFELYFNDRSKEELQQIKNKVALLSSVFLIRYHYTKCDNTSKEIQEKIKYYQQKLLSLIDIVDDLKI